MKGALAATAALLLAFSASPAAHRLDEYLQAARLSFARTHVGLEVDLTPGATVAAAVITMIDRDGNGEISPIEAEWYGHAVLSDLVMELDDREVPMTLLHVEVPSLDELRRGVGTIQLRATGNVENAESRRSELHFQNNHQAASSVYLVNALMPEDGSVSVGRQTRDARQQDVRIDYQVGPSWPAHLYWPALGAAALLLVVRRARLTTNN